MPAVRLAQITQPTLDVLETLLDGEQHGYSISKATGRGTPTVSKILRRLEATGWCTSRLEAPGGISKRPPRRYYTLTPAGADEAARVLTSRRRSFAARVQRAAQPAGAVA